MGALAPQLKRTKPNSATPRPEGQPDEPPLLAQFMTLNKSNVPVLVTGAKVAEVELRLVSPVGLMVIPVKESWSALKLVRMSLPDMDWVLVLSLTVTGNELPGE